MTAHVLMIQGTASSVGKSLVAAGLCRLFKRQGFSVAPFKSQNMSSTSFITEEGHEISRAQAVQAYAAGVTPSALMNPILLKPCSDRKSHVIVQGKLHSVMGAADYFAYKDAFIPIIKESFAQLSTQYEVIIIEGAGSPAEINLLEKDFVNMGMADIADAPVILVGDIDRGGVFAALYGTVKLLPKMHQSRIMGIVINKFRGDEKILQPGLIQLEEILGIPVFGVLPYREIFIAEEDSVHSLAYNKNMCSLKEHNCEYDHLANMLEEYLDIPAILGLVTAAKGA